MHPEQARRTFSVSQAVANYALRLNCLAPRRLAVLPPKQQQQQWLHLTLDRQRVRLFRRGRQTAADGHRLGLCDSKLQRRRCSLNPSVPSGVGVAAWRGRQGQKRRVIVATCTSVKFLYMFIRTCCEWSLRRPEVGNTFGVCMNF